MLQQTVKINVQLVEKGKLLVCEKEAVDWLSLRGYGAPYSSKTGCLELEPCEALYLLTTGTATVRDVKAQDLSEHYLMRLGLKKTRDFLTKYIVYRDLRSRGYVVRKGYGLGNDLRVYERGSYGKKEAKYLVVALNEGKEISARKLVEYQKTALRLGKELVVAVVERRGDVIYYKVSQRIYWVTSGKS